MGLIVLRVTGSRAGALLAAIVAVLSGGITAKLQWTNVVEAYAWIPWVLLPLVRRPAPTRGGLVASAALWGVQALTGHPNTWAWTGLAAVVVLFASHPRPVTLARAGAFALLGIAVGAVQLLPTLLLTTVSVRHAGISADEIFTSSATAADPLLFAFANAFVRASDAGWDLATVWYANPPFSLIEASAYVGMPVLALAAIGAHVRRCRPFVVLLLVMLTIPALAALRPGWWTQLPLLNGLRSPVRTYLIADLAFAVLAGAGVARLARDRRGLAWAFGVTIAALSAYAVALTLATSAPSAFDSVLRTLRWRPDMSGSYGQEVERNAVAALSAPWPLLFETAVAVSALAVLRSSSTSPRVARAGVAALAALPLLFLSPQANPVRPVADFSYAEQPLERALVATGAHRAFTLSDPGWYSGLGDQLQAAGISSLRMFSSLDLAATEDLLPQLERSADARRAAGIDVVVSFGELCPGSLLAYVDSDRAFICRSTNALTPPYWVPRAAAITSEPASSPWSPRDASLDLSAVARSAIALRADRTGAVTVDAPTDGWVYFDRAWWPAWHVRVDGYTVAPLRALGGQLVPVNAGTHVVASDFFADEAAIGLASGAVVLVAAGAWALGWRRPTAFSLRPARGRVLPLPRAR